MIEFTSFRKYAAFAGYFVLFVAGFGNIDPAWAARDVYEVRAVEVDVSSESATEARKIALEQGAGIAFRKLLERLTLKADHDRLPDLRREEIAGFVRDFGVSDEKTSATRYLAKLSYRFKRAEVRQLLADFNLQFAETLSKPVLVLPVYQEAGALSLWDDPNPWRDAWNRGDLSGDLVPLRHPLGGLNDISAIGPEQAIQGDRERMQAISDRYGTSAVIIAFARLELDADLARRRLEVFVTRYDHDPEPFTDELRYHQNEGETIEGLLGRASVGVSAHIENHWKQVNLLNLNQKSVASIAIPITGLKDWLNVEKRLKSVALVRKYDLVLLSLDEARINLYYLGGPDQLQVSLGQADLTMVSEDGEWVIYFGDIFPAETP